MCTPVPLNNKVSGRTADNNNYQEENNEVQPNQQLPPPLPKKTVAPYQVARQITMSWTIPDHIKNSDCRFTKIPPNVFLRCQIAKYVGIQVWTRGTNAKYGREQPSCEGQEEEEASNKKDGTVN